MTLTTPVDFHTPAQPLSRWVRGVDTDLMAACGNVARGARQPVPGADAVFWLTQEKYVKLPFTGRPEWRAVDGLRAHGALDLRWPRRRRGSAGAVRRWFYQENALVRGTRQYRRPARGPAAHPPALLNLYALEDHIAHRMPARR